MLESVKIIRVFIGSPGGLEDERRAAREVIEEVNLANSEHWGCLFKLVGWEDTIPGYQRAQSLINADLDKCQYFIGVLWNRWGTKPDLDGTAFTSGFEEEFHRARGLIDAGSMKDIALYFKEVNVPQGLEPGPEIRKVKEFRTKCIEEKRIFFKDFVDTVDFRDLVRRKITEIGWREFEPHAPPDPRNNDAEQSPQESVGVEASSGKTIFDSAALEFLSDMSSRTGEWEQTSSYEVARFRLIAASVSRSGNDELYLGPHDANLIFRHRKEISLSKQEIRALVDCGIVGFTNQNVPLWRWLAALGSKSDRFERIKLLAVVGNSEEQESSIKLLQILGETVSSLNRFLNAEAVLTGWLQSEASNQIFDNAAQFLSYNGVEEDVEIINKISASSSAEKRAKLNAIVATIKARSSSAEALKFICANNVETVPERLVDVMFSSPSTLPTDILSLCLIVKSDAIRLKAAKLVIERGELSEMAAQELLSDSSYEIRLLAVEFLQKCNDALPDEIVKTVLTIKRSNLGLNFFNAARTDTTYYDRYLDSRLHELDFAQLKERVAAAGVFNDKELFTLYRKFNKKLADEIRANLRDRFTSMFESSVRKDEAMPGVPEDYRAKVYGVWASYQKKLCSGALAALCRLMVRTDMGLVRDTLDALEIEASPELLVYLAKFGDWTDVDRIQRLSTSWTGGLSLLYSSLNLYTQEKAAAIFELGKSRITDLLNADLSAPIRNSVTKLLPAKVFQNLSIDAIIAELDRKDDEYRVIFALRCVESLSKERIESILDRYLHRDTTRYYNSVHWLDLGVSLPKKQATAIVRRELTRRSQ